MKLYADIVGVDDILTPRIIFNRLRPDIALISADNVIHVLELTICHESNMQKSKDFKTNKYSNLRSDLSHPFKSHGLTINTIEVTSLGFISDIRSFTTKTINQTLPTVVSNEITKTVISQSFNIYKNRNVI